MVRRLLFSGLAAVVAMAAAAGEVLVASIGVPIDCLIRVMPLLADAPVAFVRRVHAVAWPAPIGSPAMPAAAPVYRARAPPALVGAV